jgi:hypothetical protein
MPTTTKYIQNVCKYTAYGAAIGGLAGLACEKYIIPTDYLNTLFNINNNCPRLPWQNWGMPLFFAVLGSSVAMGYKLGVITQDHLIRSGINRFFKSPSAHQRTFSQRLAAINFPEENIPAHLCDVRISTQIMNNPVFLTGDGGTYDKENIKRWFDGHRTSPMTGLPLSSANRSLYPNIDKKREIEEFVSQQEHLARQELARLQSLRR